MHCSPLDTVLEVIVRVVINIVVGLGMPFDDVHAAVVVVADSAEVDDVVVEVVAVRSTC